MGMGIVSDTEFESDRGKLCPKDMTDPTSHDAVIIDLEKGRGTHSLQVPDALRKVIGQEKIESGRASALELANNFGVSPSSVSAYSVGAHSTSSIATQPDKNVIIGAKLRIAKKARNRLTMALNSITQEKIDGAKVKDIAGVAKDMAAVIRTMEPEQSRTGEGGPTFIFYSPQFRQESNFETVIVKE
jgi:hypothetical protein